MSSSTNLLIRLKTLGVFLPAFAALVYFAVDANVLVAMGAVLVTVLLSLLVKIDAPQSARNEFDEAAAKLSAFGRSQGIVEFKLDGTILSANENFLNLVGYREGELAGEHNRMLIDPEFAISAAYRALWESLNRGESVSDEFKLSNKDGKQVWIQASYNPVLDLRGRPVKIVLICSDVTAQKMRLMDFAGQLEVLGKCQAVIEFHLDGTIITANDNFLELMGYQLNEVQGKHHSLFVDPEYVKSNDYLLMWQRLNAGESFSQDYKRIAKGGKEVWIQASYSPVLDINGRPVKVIKFATDVTAQKILHTDNAGQMVAIGRSHALIEFELDGTIITANDNFLNATGYRLDEVQGKHHSMFVEPEYARSQEYRSMWQTLNAGEYLFAEFERVAKGGQKLWFEASYSPILGPNGKPTKVVKFASDITQRKLEAAENKVIRQAIATVSSNVVIADENFDIMYMNPSAEAMFRNSESDFRQALPRFDSSTILGANIDTFHENPAHQRSMLQGLTRPHTTQLSMGEKTFKIVAIPLNEGGQRVGAVLEWYDRTQEIAIEDEVKSVVHNALNGDLSHRISLDDKDGFLESLSKGVNQLVGISDRVIDDTITVLSAIAEGDLSKTMDGEYQGAYERLKKRRQCDGSQTDRSGHQHSIGGGFGQSGC